MVLSPYHEEVAFPKKHMEGLVCTNHTLFQTKTALGKRSFKVSLKENEVSAEKALSRRCFSFV